MVSSAGAVKACGEAPVSTRVAMPGRLCFYLLPRGLTLRTEQPTP